MNRTTNPVREDPIPSLLIGAIGVIAVLAVLNWLSAELAWMIARGHRLQRPVTYAVAALWSLRRDFGDPAVAWGVGPAEAPSPAIYYASTGLVLAAFVGAALGIRRFVGSTAGRSGAHGARWAGRGELRQLVLRRNGRGRRLVVGTVRGRLARRMLATEARHSLLVLGPTQSGKTTGLAIPALLEWEGPVVATSVKDDLARITMQWRSRRGPVWLFDPSAASGLQPLARWSPLALCTDWTASQRVASWLVDSTPARTGMADAAFWYAAAAKQLAPLLLAAADAGWSVAEVVRWTNTSEFDEPGQLLRISGHHDAATALTACANRDERIRSSVATTLETVLAPFEDPVVSSWTSASDFDVRDLFEAPGATLYLCGPSHEQNRVQGVFSALLSSVVAEAVERAGRTGRALDPPLLMVLDEAANIAPVHDLDTVASTCAGIGIQLVTVCQDLGQLSGRYGNERARTIVNNHRAKLLLSGVSDLPTLDLVSGLAGEEAVREESYTVDQKDGRRTRSSAVAFRRLLPSDRLRRIAPGQGVLVYAHLPPMQIRLRPWFNDRLLRRLVNPPQA